MRKTKSQAVSKKKVASKKRPSVRRAKQQPLAAGQIWRVGEQILQVLLVGKLLVHYKLAPSKWTKRNTEIFPVESAGWESAGSYHSFVLDAAPAKEQN